MLGYILRRLLIAIPTLVMVSLIVFFMIRLIPGDPAQVMLGEGADPESLAAMHRELGLDQPVFWQYLHWVGHALQGDLGRSIATGEPVGPLILSRFWLTALIVIVALTLATIVAVVAGMIAGWKRGSSLDLAISGGASLVLAVPSFWLGLMLLLLFGVKLGWLPVVGFAPFSDGFFAALPYLILPIATLAISESGALIRMMRASTIDVLGLDYVTHAYAKGLRHRTVLSRHVFPNAFAPTLTLVGLSLGHLLGGIAVTETVFTLPGLGRLMVDSILARDYPVVQGCLLFTATIYVVVNLIVDLLYPFFDPRVKA
jgi:peptide/nickel transport system permease protein